MNAEPVTILKCPGCKKFVRRTDDLCAACGLTLNEGGDSGTYRDDGKGKAETKEPGKEAPEANPASDPGAGKADTGPDNAAPPCPTAGGFFAGW